MTTMKIAVVVELDPTAEGGRRNPIGSGYVGMFWTGRSTGGVREHYDARIVLVGGAELEPGEAADAVLEPLMESGWTHLAPGDRVEFYEGAQKVGSADILELRVKRLE